MFHDYNENNGDFYRFIKLLRTAKEINILIIIPI